MDRFLLGDHSYMGTFSNPWDSTMVVGKFTSIGNGLKIISSDHPRTVTTYPFREKFGLDYPYCSVGQGIVVRNDVWIGENVTLIPPVHIENGAIIGAECVVSGFVEPYSIYIGNPKVKIGSRFNESQIESLLKISWWNWDIEKIKNNIHKFKDIDQFISEYGQM